MGTQIIYARFSPPKSSVSKTIATNWSPHLLLLLNPSALTFITNMKGHPVKKYTLFASSACSTEIASTPSAPLCLLSRKKSKTTESPIKWAQFLNDPWCQAPVSSSQHPVLAFFLLYTVQIQPVSHHHYWIPLLPPAWFEKSKHFGWLSRSWNRWTDNIGSPQERNEPFGTVEINLWQLHFHGQICKNGAQ